jgi:hypothetical protein
VGSGGKNKNRGRIVIVDGRISVGYLIVSRLYSECGLSGLNSFYREKWGS